MLDIKFVRENPDIVRENIKKTIEKKTDKKELPEQPLQSVEKPIST